MAQTTLSVRMDADVKRQLDELCRDVGMSTSTAVNVFAKAFIRERRLPFEIVASDPFYSEQNMARLRRAAADLDAGKGKLHEVDYSEAGYGQDLA